MQHGGLSRTNDFAVFPSRRRRVRTNWVAVKTSLPVRQASLGSDFLGIGADQEQSIHRNRRFSRAISFRGNAMINFACPQCNQGFEVEDKAAGKKTSCGFKASIADKRDHSAFLFIGLRPQPGKRRPQRANPRGDERGPPPRLWPRRPSRIVIPMSVALLLKRSPIRRSWPRWPSRTRPRVWRKAAVERLTNQTVSAKGRLDDQRSARGRLNSIRRFWETVAFCLPDAKLRKAACELDQALLAKVAATHEKESVRMAAVENLTDQTLLAKLAIEAKEWCVREAAIKNLDQMLLAKLAIMPSVMVSKVPAPGGVAAGLATTSLGQALVGSARESSRRYDQQTKSAQLCGV